ncbi:ribosome small subunit-dependent GTPase A [Velocimicrobium porci]|uniref:Small ribosomal subunit biogenesis GTPase RsgA n=1 Tax=Velocimicrobium porci TaxID=2606634 RepID=A0A6L5XW40_9FIRM|nr:ribosome small subunit-dependent GTPase A [Velocimicrobium porci]MSS63046.1 ribosome small subunit-dependent GTPase A [Velocimicrobium porci]
MQGKIVKGIAGFYYIHTQDDAVYECKAKGIFRNQKIKPLVGDNVEIAVLDREKKIGNIEVILPRKNELIRPAVSNVDQALVIFAAAKPEPNLNLLDRFLITMEKQNVETVVCFNKTDVASEAVKEHLLKTYGSCGYKVIFTSALFDKGLDCIRAILKDKTTVVAGPSGVGKSSIINLIAPCANMETGVISEKIERGKHTTRHSQLFCIEKNTYIMDTPGFSSLYIDKMEKEELKDYFIEFQPFEEECRFTGCVHINEPDCGVKEALQKDRISRDRYENYLLLYEELKNRKKY